MKKIVVYINTMNASGGIERVVANLLNKWNTKYSIVLLVKDNKQSFYSLPDNIDIISINEPLILDMKNRLNRIFSVMKNLCNVIIKLKIFLKMNEFDYLYTVTPLNSLEFYLASPNLIKKMVISEHASAFAVNKIYHQIKRYLYPKAYCISVPNKTDCRIYKSWGCRTVYIPHLTTFKPQKKNRLDTKIILNVGRLTSDKRQLELLKIWNNIKEKNGWKLRIVGSGEEKKSLYNEIKRFKMEDTVELIEHTPDIQSIYKNASVFVFTSRMEGFGMALLEAMSFGIPCISYDCPSGPRDIIKNGYNGFLIDNGNMEEMRDGIEKIMNFQFDELLSLGKHAFITAREWNNEEILRKWEKVYA